MSTYKVIYLSSCSTCKKIMKDLPIDDNWELQDIKKQMISAEQLSTLSQEVEDIRDLFNKRAQKYKGMEPKIEDRTDEEVKELILSDYTFVKRPIVITQSKTFIGNSKKVIQELQEYFS